MAKRKGFCTRIKNKFLDYDMFGAQVQFNVEGRNKWNTCCGALISILIVLITVAFGFYQFRKAVQGSVLPQISTIKYPDYFSDLLPISQEVDNW